MRNQKYWEYISLFAKLEVRSVKSRDFTETVRKLTEHEVKQNIRYGWKP